MKIKVKQENLRDFNSSRSQSPKPVPEPEAKNPVPESEPVPGPYEVQANELHYISAH